MEKIKVIIIGDKKAKELNPFGEKPTVKFFIKKWERMEEKLRTFEIDECAINCSCDRKVEPPVNCSKEGCKFDAEILKNGKIKIL